MLQKRIIPVLQMSQSRLVKTVNFKKPAYIGDPCNTARIFNELEVDELIILDINVSKNRETIDMKTLADLASECFMPLAYGGGIRHLDDAKKIFDLGYEKIILNSALADNPNLIESIASYYGSQAVVVSIDVAKPLFGKAYVAFESGTRKSAESPIVWAKTCAEQGAGEIMVTAIASEGTWEGYPIDLIADIANAVDVPVIAHGGAGTVRDIESLFEATSVRAAAAGNLFIYQKKGMGVLVNMPDVSKIHLG